MRPSLLAALACGIAAVAPAQTTTVTVDWSTLAAPTRTEITLQVVENPPLLRSSSIHDAAWSSLANLHADKPRLALWYPYPRLAIAELQPPTSTTTSWDFTHIDPIVEEFFAATAGHPSVFTMSTIPSWMFTGGGKATIPPSAEEAVWTYEDGTSLRDPTGREAAQYFARVAGWYTAGGFTDELGKRHTSTHHFPLAYWEVLNEPEYEHQLPIEQYTRLFDEVSTAVRKVSPHTRFVGMSLAEPSKSPNAFAYFLDPRNHAPDTPVDAISYHFYAQAEAGASEEAQSFSFFAQADGFLNSVRYIEAIRKRLSPRTETHINEAGCISATDIAQGSDHMLAEPTDAYLHLCAAVFAYVYAGVASQGIEVLGASQLLGYPSQYPSVSLLNWKTGQPNPRYAALDLLHSNLGPGDRPARITTDRQEVFAAAYVNASGERKLLLINRRSQPQHVIVRNASQTSAEQHWKVQGTDSPAQAISAAGAIDLRPLEVVILRQSSER